MRIEQDPSGHVPVMCAPIIEMLAPAWARGVEQGRAPIHLDITLGMGGHALAALTAEPTLRVIAVDRDEQAIDSARTRLAQAGVGERCLMVHATYDQDEEIFAAAMEAWGPQAGQIDSALADLGVSSLQLDEPERGFSYAQDAPLDMRMNPAEGVTAADVLATYERTELVRILRDYGQERFASAIASAVVAQRESEPLTRSSQLVELVRAAIPMAVQRTSKGNPAKRTFQALRIEVNDELRVWERTLPAVMTRMRVGARVAVLSYHSLEDRITKQALVNAANSTTPAGLPVELPEHAPWMRLITRGAAKPETTEMSMNPRSTSARLRVAEKIRDEVTR